MHEYERGEPVIHPRYGAGTVIGEKELTIQGKTRAYHIIELVGERGEVMVPVEMATDMNIRPAIKNLSVIEDVFASPPLTLSDDYRTRQAKIQKQIQTRDPQAMAEALRDLFWREHNDRLTTVEVKMKSRLMQMLSREIAVIRPNMNVEKAASHLTEMLHEMVRRGAETDDDEEEEAAPQTSEDGDTA